MLRDYKNHSPDKKSESCQLNDFQSKESDALNEPDCRVTNVNMAEAKCEPVDGPEIIKKICEFYFDDVALQTALENWATRHAGIFNPFDREYSLGQMDRFREFKDLLEGQLEK